LNWSWFWFLCLLVLRADTQFANGYRAGAGPPREKNTMQGIQKSDAIEFTAAFYWHR
jgi:hypothetical protein